MENEKEYTEEEKREVWNDFREKKRQVMEQREEIMTAFFAKYQCEPEDMVQIEEKLSATQAAWYVVHKKHVIFCQRCKDVIANGMKESANDKSINEDQA